MAHHHYQQPEPHDNPKFLLDALYCSEEHWEEQVEVVEDELEDEYCCDSLSTNTSTSTIINSPPLFLEKDMFWDDEELTSLLAKEQQNPLCTFLQINPVLEVARREAVEWMLKVNAHYSFSALTAVLAVDYLDRFLFSFRFQNGKPWMTQLTAVACLSLAAKVEETQVPLLLDLQVEDSRYLFEAKTIKKMEILVLSTLGWKMNPATPVSFLDFITRRLGSKYHLCLEFLRRCNGVLLSVIADSRFMCYLPSVLANATMMHVVNCVEPRLGVAYQSQLLGIVGINKEKVEECCKLMLELGSGCDQGKQCMKRKFGSIPGSPNGVMDVSFSCDSSNDSWGVATSVSSSPEPLSKKTRTQDQLLLNCSKPDFLSIPR
ncbi:cyclin-D3-2-like [Gastrolobium bilobum]|uniref:cyclin-D3-2-like n=1 Tax=Gastrolobium bilobum TaxID=150636 RepID=UPI002AB26A08|nr:cyclin-D3-2-like [Gastrolobium bilobum]